MGEYLREELWGILDDKSLLFGARDDEFINYVQAEPYSKWQVFKNLWDGP
jgi:hypothetical protein